MSIERSKKGIRILVLLPLIALCILLMLIAVPLFAFGYVDAILHGPKIVLSVPSPDGNYEAYVEEAPSIDPPNQSLFVERSDKLHFMHIAKLAGDYTLEVRAEGAKARQFKVTVPAADCTLEV